MTLDVGVSPSLDPNVIFPNVGMNPGLNQDVVFSIFGLSLTQDLEGCDIESIMRSRDQAIVSRCTVDRITVYAHLDVV
jgi:hypothetical protein